MPADPEPNTVPSAAQGAGASRRTFLAGAAARAPRSAAVTKDDFRIGYHARTAGFTVG